MIFLVSIVFVDYIKAQQELKFIEWDIKTITAGDYTVEFNIDSEFYKQFEDRFLDKFNPMPEIMQLKYFIKDELERRLGEIPCLGFEGRKGDIEPIKICLVTFAFDNCQLINWLKERGSYIKTQ